jgi:hypothetical protein
MLIPVRFVIPSVHAYKIPTSLPSGRFLESMIINILPVKSIIETTKDMPPTLPTEILRMIFEDNADDEATLKRLSTLSREF